MKEPTQQEIEDLFFEALDLPSTQRGSFLDQRCQDNDLLRAKVDALLAADAAAGGEEFLESAFMAAADNPPPAEDAPSALGNETAPETARFKVVAKHRQGGLGEVWIAYDRQLKREVAIKQIKPKWQSHDEARQRFVQEAEVTGKLEHPGVVPVYAMGTWEDGRHFYAMRFIQGTTLKEAIQRYHDPHNEDDDHSRQLQLRQLLNAFVDVCNTIGYAHSRHILHRDIKPSNIMVGPYGETLVVDWGLAKLLDAPFDESLTMAMLADSDKESGSTPTRVGGTVGTPQYMSPEQASGRLQDIGVGTDIYLLGATLFQILTGRPPHSEESISKLLERVAQGKLTLPHVLSPDVPPALEAICLKAMAANPKQRYMHSGEMAEDIERWMADEPVSVFQDPWSDRLGRWVRRHRTLAYSGAVAAILLTVGSIAGSAFWSYSRAQQFRVQRERNAKEAILEAERQQRLNELAAAARLADQFATNESQANRFSSAVELLRSAMDSIGEEPLLQIEHKELEQKAERLQRIIDFYRLAEFAEERNVLSRDAKAIMACSSAIQALGVWDKEDWWVHLPDQDLTPAQKNQLRWDTYQQWLLLDSTLTKVIGTRLLGTGRSGSISGFFKSLRRLRGTNLAKPESEAVLVISDRIEKFRLSEAARWYRGVAQFRLNQGARVAASDLDYPRNAADAQKLGVLCMIAALDRGFQIFFRDYQGKDPLEAARDLFNRSSTLRPDHYWTQLALAQVQYKLAEKSADTSWRKFDPAIQATGRCIALDPEKCFAYADRSSIYRAQAHAIRLDESLPEKDRKYLADELLQWSLADADVANRLGQSEPWVGWQHGLALFEIGESELAIKRFLEASKLTYSLLETADAALVKVDDLRGRSDTRVIADRLANEDPSILHHTLAATIALNQNRLDAAIESAEKAIAMPGVSAHAFSVRGMVKLNRKDFTGASQDFRRTINVDANHDWAVMGLAYCDEQSGNLSEAMRLYKQAQSSARTDDNRAAALLGQARILADSQKFGEALAAIKLAQRLNPGCDLTSIWQQLVARFKSLDDEDGTKVDLKEFLRELSELPAVSKIKIPEQQSDEYHAALFNGGFELDLYYWSDLSGNTWNNENGYRSTATVSKSLSHSGASALHIRGGEAADEDQMGRTGQTFPVEANKRYRVTLHGKANGMREGALRVNVLEKSADGEEPVLTQVIEFQSGSYDWTPFEGTFETQAAEKAVTAVRIEIVSSGPGTGWIDDIQVNLDR